MPAPTPVHTGHNPGCQVRSPGASPAPRPAAAGWPGLRPGRTGCLTGWSAATPGHLDQMLSWTFSNGWISTWTINTPSPTSELLGTTLYSVLELSLSHTPLLQAPKASDLPPPPPKLKSLREKARGGLDLQSHRAKSCSPLYSLSYLFSRVSWKS